MTWLVRAARQGHREAQRELGQLFQAGELIPKIDLEAFRWFLSAARQGDAKAQKAVAAYYELGRVVPKDPVRAYLWQYVAEWGVEQDRRSDDMRAKLSREDRLKAWSVIGDVAEWGATGLD